MRLVRQGKNQCGQACIAMLANVSLKFAIVAIDKRGQTTTRDLRRGLEFFGVGCGNRLTRVKRGRALPPTCILALKGDGWKHWVVWHNQKYYDPAGGVFRKRPRSWGDARITSYLTISI